MRSDDDLITTTREHIRWSAAIGDLAHPGPPRRRPGPLPWAAAVSGLAQAAGVKRIAATLPRSGLRSQLEAGAARSIEDILDECCGTRAPGSGPGPGPQARAIAIAAEVAAMANSQQPGFLRDELLRIAGQALLRPFGRRLR